MMNLNEWVAIVLLDSAVTALSGMAVFAVMVCRAGKAEGKSLKGVFWAKFMCKSLTGLLLIAAALYPHICLPFIGVTVLLDMLLSMHQWRGKKQPEYMSKPVQSLSDDVDPVHPLLHDADFKD